MDVNKMEFPVLCISQYLVSVAESIDSVVVCGKGALRNGYYDNMLLIEPTGKAHRIGGAKKLHGVGALWGYRLFYTQRIKVQLLFDGNPFQMSVDEVKKLVFNSFKKWHGWASRGDFEELRAKISEAKSISEIIEHLQTK